jgi:hypothetical protein
MVISLTPQAINPPPPCNEVYCYSNGSNINGDFSQVPLSPLYQLDQ